jgi:type IV pilus assembly protein PilZ
MMVIGINTPLTIIDYYKDTSMADTDILPYVIHDPLELNLAFMPFIKDGGIFMPTQQAFALEERVIIDLQLPGTKEPMRIEGKVVWITPPNALHHVLPGIGIQFTGQQAPTVRSHIEMLLDSKTEIGGYTYGISGDTSPPSQSK